MAADNQTNNKKTCFVVMGFGTKTDYATGRVLDLNKSYRLLIKPVVEAKGLQCVRADEIKQSGLIDVPMYQQLFQADVVVADLSTANPNAFYELGIRHALKPHTTIVVSEDKLTYPFDVNHVSITSYTHLGNAIDYEEVLRFQGELGKMLDAVLKQQQTDSPVYTYLELVPPALQQNVKETMQEVKEVLETSAKEENTPPAGSKNVKAGGKNETLAFLIDQGELAISQDNFSEAKTLFSMALRSKAEGTQENALDNDPYLIQRLVLATYKAKKPDKVTALNDALKLLSRLDLENTNDPETLGLAGAIEKRLFEEEKGTEHLNKAIQYYSRGYYLRNDYYNGINLAFLLNLRTDSALDAKNEEKIADLVNANRVRQDVLLLCQNEIKKLNDCDKHADQEGIIEPENFREEQQAKTRDQKFWVTASKAEAYFGLGNMPAYEETKSEAKSLAHADWMMETFEQQINKLKILLEKHGHLLNPPWPEVKTAQ